MVDSDRGARSRVRSTIVSAVQFLWNCREAALHIISPVAIDRQLNFLMFRPLCAVDRKFLSEIFLGRVRICAIGLGEGVTYYLGNWLSKPPCYDRVWCF
ncbi:hypothetical protein NDI47_04875 [Microcoleus vaginatus GB1-A2]|uniref:hypothetical protein n=1 Tax=Microcoleus vaginatus TaxID=119532 RepID=UPI001688FCF6|nr:hypothetical protein [Microcoleus sp. FACHB-61]